MWLQPGIITFKILDFFSLLERDAAGKKKNKDQNTAGKKIYAPYTALLLCSEFFNGLRAYTPCDLNR